MVSARQLGIAVQLGIVGAIAACGGGPTAGPAAPAGTPAASPSLVATDPAKDPITGEVREAPSPAAFPAPRSEHLCSASEEVVFACTLEGPPPQIVTSLCMPKGSSRKSPIVRGRERVDGRVDEPFAKDPGLILIMVLETNEVPFSVEIGQRTGDGGFGFEKATDPRAPAAPPKYQRLLTIGRGPDAKRTRVACDAGKPLTDNLEAMRAYKL